MRVRTGRLLVIVCAIALPLAYAHATGHGEGPDFYNPADYENTTSMPNLPTSKGLPSTPSGMFGRVSQEVTVRRDGDVEINGLFGQLKRVIEPNTSATRTLVEDAILQRDGARQASTTVVVQGNNGGSSVKSTVVEILPQSQVSGNQASSTGSTVPDTTKGTGIVVPPVQNPKIDQVSPAPNSRGAFEDFITRSVIGNFFQQVTTSTNSSHSRVPIDNPAISPKDTEAPTVANGNPKDTDFKPAGKILPAPVSPPVNVDPIQTPPVTARDLDEIGQAVHTISRGKREVENSIRTIVTERANESLETVARSMSPAAPLSADTPAPFSESDRQKKLDEVRAMVETKGRELGAELSATIANPVALPLPPGRIDPVLRSSIEEIRLLIQAETGSPVRIEDTRPFAPPEQEVRRIEEVARQIEEQRETLVARDGLDLYIDTDNDGISDYDERTIYRTDPKNAFTAGSALTDGERVLLGLDALSKSSDIVPVESPRTAGTETQALFEVTAITYASPSLPDSVLASSTSPVTEEKNLADKPLPKALRFSGKALPNSFITLYVFSTPIVVTVKTDNDGSWTYILDKEIENGEHNLYVASVNNSGKIIAKSAPVPFTKTAEALDFEPLTIQEITPVSPLDTLREHFIVTGGVLILLFGLVVLVVMGLRGGIQGGAA